MKLWKEENQVRQARPASDVIARNLRGTGKAVRLATSDCGLTGKAVSNFKRMS